MKIEMVNNLPDEIILENGKKVYRSKDGHIVIESEEEDTRQYLGGYYIESYAVKIVLCEHQEFTFKFYKKDLTNCDHGHKFSEDIGWIQVNSNRPIQIKPLSPFELILESEVWD